MRGNAAVGYLCPETTTTTTTMGGWVGRDQSDSLSMRRGPAGNKDVGRGPARAGRVRARGRKVRAMERLKWRVSERLIFHPSRGPSGRIKAELP